MVYNYAWCDNCKKLTDYRIKNHELRCDCCGEVISDDGEGCYSLFSPTKTIHIYRKLCKGETLSSFDLENTRAKEQALIMLKTHKTRLFGAYSPVEWYPKKSNAIEEKEIDNVVNKQKKVVNEYSRVLGEA